MIEIVKMKEFSSPTEKPIIPPQLAKHWANVFDSEERLCYVIYAEDEGAVKEQLNFCIIKSSIGTFLVSMPYIGYGSCFDRSNKKYLKELFSRLESFAIENDCLTMSVVTHPLATLPFESYQDVFNYCYSYTNFCQISELTEHPLQKMKHKRRMAFKNEISKLEGSSDFLIDTDPDENVFDKWFEVYIERYRELGGYPLSKELYSKYYRESRNNDKIDFRVIRNESTVICGVIFTIGKNIVDYNTSVIKTEYRKLYPTTYLLNRYFKKLIDLGIHYFNWQSSPSKEGGVYQYKKRWGAGDYEHYYFSKPLVDLTQITSIPLEKLKRELTGCYVLPYSLWGDEIKK